MTRTAPTDASEEITEADWTASFAQLRKRHPPATDVKSWAMWLLLLAVRPLLFSGWLA
jgi:hypothetical protein